MNVLAVLMSYFLFVLGFISSLFVIFFFFFNDTATTEIYTLSLHDRSSDLRAIPDSSAAARTRGSLDFAAASIAPDRKSTRLNSSHSQISYAVFCLKKKK